MADRINSIFGMEIHGIASSVTNFGPGVLASFDVIILALDNYAAKIYVNQIWKTIPDKDRPLLVFGGTFKDIAQCYGIDGSSICLRDTVNEELLKNPLIRASCTGIDLLSRIHYKRQKSILIGQLHVRNKNHALTIDMR